MFAVNALFMGKSFFFVRAAVGVRRGAYALINSPPAVFVALTD